jgi:hypothetical protein
VRLHFKNLTYCPARIKTFSKFQRNRVRLKGSLPDDVQI